MIERQVITNSLLGIISCALLSACASDEFAIRHGRADDLTTFVESLPAERDGVAICYPPGIFGDIELDELAEIPPDLVATIYGRPCTLESASSLVLHAVSTSNGKTVPDRDLTCGDLQRVSLSTDAHDVWVYLAEPDSVSALMFAIAYDEGVEVLDWVPVVDALAIPSDDWPSSGSHLALAFHDCFVGEGSDRLQVIGRLTVRAGSSGTLRVTSPGPGPTGKPFAELVDCRGRNQDYNLRSCAFGAVALGPGAEPPAAACGPCAAGGE